MIPKVHLNQGNHNVHDDNGHHHINPNNHGGAFVIAIILNSVYVIAEFTYGFIANSAALIADAEHNLSRLMVLCHLISPLNRI